MGVIILYFTAHSLPTCLPASSTHPAHIFTHTMPMPASFSHFYPCPLSHCSPSCPHTVHILACILAVLWPAYYPHAMLLTHSIDPALFLFLFFPFFFSLSIFVPFFTPDPNDAYIFEFCSTYLITVPITFKYSKNSSY